MTTDRQREPASQAATQGPVFIVGMNGSGTTMLLDSLGRHTSLYGIARETRLMPHVIRAIRRLGDLDDDNQWRKAWDLARNIPAIKFVNGGEAPALPADWQSVVRQPGAVFEQIYAELAARDGKSRWCEKTPQHAQHIALLAETFGSARFIHMIRDGRACAASFSRRWRRTAPLTIHRWKHVVRAGRAQGNALPDGRYLEVHYEQLTGDPEHWMRTICEFLEIPFEAQVLESRRPQSAEPGKPGTIEARKSGWEDYFAERDTRQLERIAGAYLHELGYTTLYERGDQEPTAAQKRLWRAKDAFWLWMQEIARKFKGSKKPWSRVLLQPLESIRQARSNDY